MHRHEVIVGSCGHVIRQCRCAAPDKPRVTVEERCGRCGPGTARDEEIRRHGARIAQLSRDITAATAEEIRQRAVRIIELLPEQEPRCVTCGGKASALWGRITTDKGDVFACSQDCARAFITLAGSDPEAPA